MSDVLGCSIALADIRIVQGRLREAMSTYERGLQLATAPGTTVLRGTADMHVGISELLRERNDIAEPQARPHRDETDRGQGHAAGDVDRVVLLRRQRR